MVNWQKNLEKIRGWIDGETQFDISENVIKAHDNKSDSELFLLKLLNSIEVLLKQNCPHSEYKQSLHSRKVSRFFERGNRQNFAR